MPSLPDVLAWLVIFSVPIHLYASWKMWGLLRTTRMSGLVLQERLIMGIWAAAIVTIFGVVFLNNELDTPLLKVPQTQVITRLPILSLIIPPLYWLWLYRKWLREDKER